jgi:hypothetical protein
MSLAALLALRSDPAPSLDPVVTTLREKAPDWVETHLLNAIALRSAKAEAGEAYKIALDQGIPLLRDALERLLVDATRMRLDHRSLISLRGLAARSANRVFTLSTISDAEDDVPDQ